MLAAKNQEELLQLLCGIDVSVPLRSQGRKSEHVERYAVVHLLSTLAEWGLGYPVELSRRERPDFLLRVGGRSIGLEHTEAVPQNQAQADALREAGYGPETYFIRPAVPGEKKKPAKTLIREIESDEPGDGWVGNAPEKEWARAMAHFTVRKLGTIRKEGFERFEENWLLIYDNWPLPAVRREEASELLMAELHEVGAFAEFQLIFVLSDHMLCQLSQDAFAVGEVSSPRA